MVRPIVLSLLVACGGGAATEPAAKPAPAASGAPAAVAPAAAAPAAPPPAPAAAVVSRIITGAGVRVRATADASAAEVARLSIGEVVPELERGAAPVRIGGKEDVWVRVRTAAGAEGWVFGALTQVVPAGGEGTALLDLAERRVEQAAADTTAAAFADLAELTNTLEAAPAAPGAASLRLRWLRLASLQAAMSAAAMGDTTPAITSYIKAHEGSLFYEELGNRQIVKHELVDAILAEAKGTELDDRIQWSASNWPSGGECEGEPSCVLGRALGDKGLYAKRFPKGTYIKAALEGLKADFEWVADADPSDFPFEKADLRPQVAEARAIIAAAAPTDAGWKALLAKLDAKLK